MGGRRGWRLACAALITWMVVAAGPATSLVPVSPHEGLGLQHVAIHALESTLRDGALYAETADRTRFFTKDQMIGVLAALAARTLRPDQSEKWAERARELWEESDAAFLENSFYARTLPAPVGVVCIDLFANSWALRAAAAMAAAGITATPDPAARMAHLRGLLGPFLTGTSSAGKPVCPASVTAVPLHERPLLFLSLLETRAGGGPDLNSTVRNSIQSTIASSFEGGFALPDGLYLTALNAQMLVVLTLATQVYDDAGFADVRDELAGWLRNETIDANEGRAQVRNVIRRGTTFERQAGEAPEGQIWLAYALSNLAADEPGRVPAGLVDSLLDSYLELFWDRQGQGFAGTGSLVYADYNLLPAILTRSQPLSVTAVDPSTFAFVVPSLASFTFPPPEAAGAGQLYILNQWTTRFTMRPEETRPVDVAVPAGDLAPLNLSLPASSFFPAPRLVRSGTAGSAAISVFAVADDPNLLRFSPQLSPGQNGLRLDAWVPARPAFSDFGSTIRIILESYASEPVVLGTLQIELEATQIRIRTASLDNVPLASMEVIGDDEDPVITEQLPEPHMRLLLTDVALPPGRSEVVLGYTDIIRPEVGRPSISRDLEGRDALTSRDNAPVQVLQGDSVFVRATVRDNAALRTVQLRYRVAEQSLDVRMSAVPGQPDVYAVQLPTNSIPTGQGTLQVVAIDAAGTGNLNESAKVTIDVRDPLFAGSIVLFVFSGTLFLAAFIIWLKVRRKALR